MISKLTNLVHKFHNDEEGLEALQVVMIIAIAALILIACATLGQKAVAWMGTEWDALGGSDGKGEGIKDAMVLGGI